MEYEWAHEVVFFVTQNMAVPHVFIVKVGELVGIRSDSNVRCDTVHELCLERRGIAGQWIDLGKAQLRTNSLRWIKNALALWQAERHHRMHRSRRNIDVFQRIHAQHFLPADFVGLGRFYHTGPVDAVDRPARRTKWKCTGVRVHAVVRDLPDLCLAILDAVDAVDRRIDICQRDGRRNGRAGERQFHRQGCIHAAVHRIKQLLNRLVDDVDSFRGRTGNNGDSRSSCS